MPRYVAVGCYQTVDHVTAAFNNTALQVKEVTFDMKTHYFD